MAERKIIQDFTRGGIPRQLFRFSLPFILSNGMQVLYSLVDMVIVGRFVNSFGLAAVSVASQACTCATAAAMGFGQGGQVYIAQLLGAGKRDGLARAVSSLFVLMLWAGLAFSVLLALFAGPILRLLNTPAEAFGMARSYLLICGGGTVFNFLYNMTSSALRGMGDSRHPFLFIVLASVINIALDLLFTGWWGWGVAGAALATVLGQAISAAASLAFLWRRRGETGLGSRPAALRPEGETTRALVRLGVPFALQGCAVNISMLFVNGMVNTMGVYAAAVFGVGLKLDDIANKASQGIQMALATIVGQNMAAGEIGRIKKAVSCTWLYAGLISAAFAVLLMGCNREMFSLFTDDENVISLAPLFASALVWQLPAMAVMRGCMGFIRGSGNGRMTLILGILDAFVFRVGFCYLLGTVCGLGLFGFLLGYALGPYGTAIPGTIYYLRGRWKTRGTLV